jgi:hypothetical protein
LEDGYNIRTVHELFGHKDVSTTMIYTLLLNKVGNGCAVLSMALIGAVRLNRLRTLHRT